MPVTNRTLPAASAHVLVADHYCQHQGQGHPFAIQAHLDSNDSNVTTASSLTSTEKYAGDDTDFGAVMYITAVLVFYSLGIVVMIIKYLRTERKEIEEEAALESFFKGISSQKMEHERQAVHRVAIQAFHTLTSGAEQRAQEAQGGAAAGGSRTTKGKRFNNLNDMLSPGYSGSDLDEDEEEDYGPCPLQRERSKYLPRVSLMFRDNSIYTRGGRPGRSGSSGTQQAGQGRAAQGAGSADGQAARASHSAPRASRANSTPPRISEESQILSEAGVCLEGHLLEVPHLYEHVHTSHVDSVDVSGSLAADKSPSNRGGGRAASANSQQQQEQQQLPSSDRSTRRNVQALATDSNSDLADHRPAAVEHSVDCSRLAGKDCDCGLSRKPKHKPGVAVRFAADALPQDGARSGKKLPKSSRHAVPCISKGGKSKSGGKGAKNGSGEKLDKSKSSGDKSKSKGKKGQKAVEKGPRNACPQFEEHVNRDGIRSVRPATGLSPVSGHPVHGSGGRGGGSNAMRNAGSTSALSPLSIRNGGLFIPVDTLSLRLTASESNLASGSVSSLRPTSLGNARDGGRLTASTDMSSVRAEGSDASLAYTGGSAGELRQSAPGEASSDCARDYTDVSLLSTTTRSPPRASSNADYQTSSSNLSSEHHSSVTPSHSTVAVETSDVLSKQTPVHCDDGSSKDEERARDEGSESSCKQTRTSPRRLLESDV